LIHHIIEIRDIVAGLLRIDIEFLDRGRRAIERKRLLNQPTVKVRRRRVPGEIQQDLVVMPGIQRDDNACVVGACSPGD
jgi:hypothetical protein